MYWSLDVLLLGTSSWSQRDIGRYLLSQQDYLHDNARVLYTSVPPSLFFVYSLRRTSRPTLTIIYIICLTIYILYTGRLKTSHPIVIEIDPKVSEPLMRWSLVPHG